MTTLLEKILGSDVAALVEFYAFPELPIDYLTDNQRLKALPYFKIFIFESYPKSDDFQPARLLTINDMKDYEICINNKEIEYPFVERTKQWNKMLKAQELNNYELVKIFKKEFLSENKVESWNFNFYVCEEKGLKDVKYIDEEVKDEMSSNDPLAWQIALSENIDLYNHYKNYLNSYQNQIVLTAIKNGKLKILKFFADSDFEYVGIKKVWSWLEYSKDLLTFEFLYNSLKDNFHTNDEFFKPFVKKNQIDFINYLIEDGWNLSCCTREAYYQENKELYKYLMEKVEQRHYLVSYIDFTDKLLIVNNDMKKREYNFQVFKRLSRDGFLRDIEKILEKAVDNMNLDVVSFLLSNYEISEEIRKSCLKIITNKMELRNRINSIYDLLK